MTTLNVCQIGCGYWGPNLMRNVAAHPRADLAGICDIDESTRAKFSQLYPDARLYESLDDVLSDDEIEAVIIATPSGMHVDQTSRALAANKHVLVEKPLAETVSDATRLHEAARAVDRTLMVGHVFLYNNLVHYVDDIIASGELGEVQYIYSQRLNLGRFRHDSDVLWTLAPHDVSIINRWLKSRPIEVRASGMSFVHRGSNVAEVCFAEMKFENGQAAHLHLSWLDPQKRRDMVVIGSKRMLLYDDMNHDRHIQIFDKSAEAEFQSDVASFAQFRTKIRAGNIVVPEISLTEPLGAEIDDFVTCCLDGGKPLADSAHAIDVTAALEAMAESMRTDRGPKAVEYP